MHALQLIEFAAAFSRHSEACVLTGQPLRREAANSYWLNCRYRHDLWSASLNKHRKAIQKEHSELQSRSWYEVLPTIHEILLSEPLTRCITQLALVLEEREIDSDFGASEVIRTG